jgi:hypothetical protein
MQEAQRNKAGKEKTIKENQSKINWFNDFMLKLNEVLSTGGAR